MCPQNFQRRGEQPTLATPPRVGPKTLANPKPTRVGKTGGPGGAKPPWRGAVGGVPPRNQKRGRAAHINKPATSGTQNAGKPSAYGGGQNGGSRGAKPPWRGAVGGVPPRNQKRGRVAHINKPATSGTQNPGKPSAYGGGQNGGPGGRSPTAKNSCHLIAFLTEEVPQKASCVHRLPPPMVVGESKNYPRFFLKVPYLRDPLL